MIFNNRQNKCHIVDGKEVWQSRSIAVVGLVLMLHEGEKYVLLGKRGPGLPNEVGKWCMPCGYLDWDETCEEAVVREIWEETGFNLYKAMNEYNVIYDHMHFPWRIHSEPDSKVQNVSLHYAVYFDTNANVYRDIANLPELSAENNVDKLEVSEVKWVNVKELGEYECVFNHDSTIKVFVNSLPIEE
ncbi:MAG: NUDIX hydrolase [Nanoarchaeota archaeon]